MSQFLILYYRKETLWSIQFYFTSLHLPFLICMLFFSPPVTLTLATHDSNLLRTRVPHTHHWHTHTHAHTLITHIHTHTHYSRTYTHTHTLVYLTHPGSPILSDQQQARAFAASNPKMYNESVGRYDLNRVVIEEEDRRLNRQPWDK